jgi:hypothetical protein
MVKYLSMDGVDDYLQLPPVNTNKVVMDVFLNTVQNASYTFVLDYRNAGTSNYMRIRSNGTLSSSGGMSVSGFASGQRATITVNSATTMDSWGSPVVFAEYTGSSPVTGLIYDLKFYLDNTLVVHYDMSTGTVDDISGNGNHATLNGGTWLDDGTGTGGEEPIGEDGSTAFDLLQSIYTDSTTQADTKQTIYSDGYLNGDTRQTIYHDGYTAYDLRQMLYANLSTSFDTKQAIFELSAVHMDTRQVIYETASTAFDMLQEYYQDGMTGSTPFDMRIQLYEDDSTIFDSKQEWYEESFTLADLKQAIYEAGELNGDMKLVLYSDSFIRGDLRQLIYSDEQIHFDTKQTIYDTKNELIGVIHLKGERKLYIELKGKRELYIPLKGGVSMTVNNPTINLVAGDSKYLVVSVDGISDLTGCTFKWGLHPRNGENILEKTSTSGISIVDGKVQIKVDPLDTELLSGTYYHECEMTDTLGNVSTIFTGLVSVSKSNV